MFFLAVCACYTHAMDSPKRMLITGAGQRIGAALAQHFAAQGWSLMLHYHRSATAAKALAAQLQQTHGTDVALLQVDLAGDLSGFWRGVPPCTAILHNAALFERDRLQDFTPAQLAQHAQVNFLAPVQLTQGFMAQLPEGAHGHVLLLGDGVMGWSVSPEFFTYALSKQALEGCLDLLAAACAPRVQVNLLALAPTLPGVTDDAAMFARLAARAPLQRTGSPDEVIAAADYLLHAPGVTGQILHLAGGQQLRTARP
jgi:NAD(P)-dependent dehydrogenase (short-subunit alcohol dehydrogenase family)